MQRQEMGGQPTTQGKTVDDFGDWINGAPPDETIRTAKLSLKRVSQLDRTYRDRFFSELKTDPALVHLFEEIRAPA